MPLTRRKPTLHVDPGWSHADWIRKKSLEETPANSYKARLPQYQYQSVPDELPMRIYSGGALRRHSQSRTRSHSGLWIQYGKALSARKTPPIEKFEKAAGPIGEAFTNPRRLWGYIADWWWVLFTDNKTKIVVSHVARVRVTRVPIS